MNPMSSAPRDGTWVLAHISDEYRVEGCRAFKLVKWHRPAVWGEYMWVEDDNPPGGYSDNWFDGWLPLPSGDGWTPTHRHRKTGGLYRLIGPATIEATMGRAAIYEARDGTTWVRPWGEFHDGRFDALPQEDE